MANQHIMSNEFQLNGKFPLEIASYIYDYFLCDHCRGDIVLFGWFDIDGKVHTNTSRNQQNPSTSLR